MDNLSMGNLKEYVKSVTSENPEFLTEEEAAEIEKTEKQREEDEKKYKAMLADIKKQTASIIKKTEKAYDLRSQKQLYDFLVHMEAGLSRFN